MYRSRNRNRQGGPNSIKGPSSALTQFLKEEGISAEAIRNRWLQRQVKGGDKKKDHQMKTRTQHSQQITMKKLRRTTILNPLYQMNLD